MQVGPYDHTVRKPSQGTVLAYWQAEEGLKAADCMTEAPQEGEVAESASSAMSRGRQHPPRRVDITGSHVGGLEADGEADEPSVAPEVTHLLLLLLLLLLSLLLLHITQFLFFVLLFFLSSPFCMLMLPLGHIERELSSVASGLQILLTQCVIWLCTRQLQAVSAHLSTICHFNIEHTMCI